MNRLLTGRRLSVLALVALGGGLAIAAGGPQLLQTPQFRSGTELIRLDVGVLDNKRRPVRGLAAADFEVQEDGKAQPITSFVAVDLSESPEPLVAWMRDIAPDVRRNDNLNDKRLVVLVLNDAMPVDEKQLIKTANAIIDRLGSRDLTAVIHMMSSRLAQDFTVDRLALRRSVDQFKMQFGDDSDIWYRKRVTVGVLRSVTDMLNGIPNRRKAIIYLGSGQDPVSETIPTLARGASKGDPTITSYYQDLFRSARLGNVNIYAIQPGDVAPSDFSLMLAHNTGGFAPAPKENYAEIDAIFQANSSYYLLGYSNPRAVADGTFRRITVKVNRPDVDVVTRNGYYADRAEPDGPKKPAAKPDSAATAVHRALSTLLPVGDLPLQVATATIRPAGSSVPTVVVVLGVRQEVGARAASSVEVVDVRVEAFTNDGKSQGVTAYTTKVAFSRSVDGVIGYELLAKLTLPPGRFQIRAAARTASDGRSGSVFADVDVPRRSRDAFDMSPIVFSTTPGLPSAPRSALSDVLPIVPTSLREFSRTLRATAWAQIALGDDPILHPITLRARIVNTNDEEVFQDQTTITPAPLERNRLATYKVELPLQNLPLGSYVLSFSATSERKSPQRRDVWFSVQ